MIDETPTVHIPENEFSWSYVRSSGPGGQNVNKVASKAVLRWNVRTSRSLGEDVKERLCAQERRRITGEGELVLSSQRYRDQERNRQDCLDKLAEIVRRAVHVPRARKPTRPSRGSKERRLSAKKRRAETKSARRLPAD